MDKAFSKHTDKGLFVTMILLEEELCVCGSILGLLYMLSFVQIRKYNSISYPDDTQLYTTVSAQAQQNT